MKSEVIAICIAACILGACASSSEQAAYVSPLKYKDYSCDEVETEVDRIAEEAAEVEEGRLAGVTPDADEVAQRVADLEALRDNAVYKNCDTDMFAAADERTKIYPERLQEWKTQRNYACPRQMVPRGVCRHDWELTHPRPVP